MFIIKEKYHYKSIYVSSENELWDWWSFTASDEISWSELMKQLIKYQQVTLSVWTVEIFTGKSLSSNNSKIKTCLHPNKYKNTVSRSLIFWVCPDCKKEVEPD